MALWNGTATSPIGVFQGLNTLTEGVMGVSILVIVWLIIYMRNADEPTRERVTGASFITAILSIFLAFLGLINGGVLGITLVLCIGSIVLLINRNNQY